MSSLRARGSARRDGAVLERLRRQAAFFGCRLGFGPALGLSTLALNRGRSPELFEQVCRNR
jgi:hypothetical protein